MIKLKEIRKQAGLSQDQLAKLAGVSVNTIRAIEQGSRVNPSIDIGKKIAHALGVKVDDLI